MQMMKTSASTAFSAVSDKYRVGYYAINTTGDFLNVGVFTGAQRYNWYNKFLHADVDDTAAGTPLRIGLANIGRMYAGKVSTLNGVSVTDPMQYSCQQNYTILSTDGYWNDATLPMKIDGVNPIDQQDGNENRPYYDGASQTKTVSQTKMYEQQQGKNTFLVESKTQQQQTSARQLDQSVVTTLTYPWQKRTQTLQKQKRYAESADVFSTARRNLLAAYGPTHARVIKLTQMQTKLYQEWGRPMPVSTE